MLLVFNTRATHTSIAGGASGIAARRGTPRDAGAARWRRMLGARTLHASSEQRRTLLLRRDDDGAPLLLLRPCIDRDACTRSAMASGRGEGQSCALLATRSSRIAKAFFAGG